MEEDALAENGSVEESVPLTAARPVNLPPRVHRDSELEPIDEQAERVDSLLKENILDQ